MNFNEKSYALSVGYIENRATADISREEQDFQAALFGLSWRRDFPFLYMLRQCVRTQFAAFVEEQIMLNFALLLSFRFTFKLRVADAIRAFAQFQIIMDIPNAMFF
uniref:Uncharacterized protein n=1 Tax=Glossina pallidipes TaxID=7398 RepID=A0A1A9ZBF5_GLOPL